MKNKDSFITQAMLSSYLTEENKDYMALLQPFVLKCLPERIGDKINIDSIQQMLNDKYHLDILYNVVEALLQRCCKEKYGSYVKKERGIYSVKKVYDAGQFEQRKLQIKQLIETVIDKLYEYLLVEKKLEKITKEDAQNYLSIFLDYYNYAIYEDPDKAQLITLNDNCAQTNYYVAQFILSEYQKESSVFDAILELIKGTLVAKSIYFFMYAPSNVSERKILGTEFYLDAPLLIDLLGLNYQYDNQAVLELVKIVRDNGGKIKTFKHYVDEVKGIIYKYAKDAKSRLVLSLDKFNREKFSEVDAIAYMETLSTRLEGMGIVIEEKPDYEDNLKNQTWHVDYAAIRNELSAQIEYGNGGHEYYPEALTHDADTIEAIAYYRGKTKECSIYDCKAIFVTKNRDIVKVIKNLFFEERFNKREINFAITDVDLTAMMWLSTFGKQNDLPKMKLLENAYAACAPSKKVLNAFLNKISNLEKNEKISQETALILRTQHSSLEDLLEITSNNVNFVNDKLIQEMEARVRNRALKEVKAGLSNEFQKLEDEKHLVGKERADVEVVREELISLQKQVVRDIQDREYISKRQHMQKQKIEADKTYINGKMDTLRAVQEKIIAKAKKSAEDKKKRCKVISYLIISIILIAFIVAFSYATYVVTDIQNMDKYSSYFLVGMTSIVSTIASVYALFKFLSKYIESFCERVYDREYSKVISANEEFFL